MECILDFFHNSVPEGRVFDSNNNITMPIKVVEGRPLTLVRINYQKIVPLGHYSFL
jgi:hypothetical protein